jgi:hypothetical protein
MSTATLPREARRNVVAFFAVGKEAKEVSSDPTSGFSKKRVQVDGKTVLQIRNMPVFRSGTFRDSMGIQHTWDDIHMDAMVQHFDLLKQRSLLEHLPVRKGHAGFLSNPGQVVDEIVGYHEALRTAKMRNPADGKEYNYLFADYDILDPTAIEKIDSGLWRNLSAEVGHWFTNDETEYWPVYSGVAYCDFSAVEGLKNYASANGVGSSFSIMTEQEQNVADGQPNGTPVPTPPAGVPVPTPQPPQQQTPPAAPAAPAQQVFEFTIGGQKVSDFAAVQAHLQRLETENAQFSQTFKEQVEAGRKAFVKSLAEGNAPRILASQLEATEQFALSLTDEQFTAWKGQWEAVAPNVALTGGGQAQPGTQGQQFSAPPAGTPGQQNDTELETAKAIVANFQLTNMAPAAIKETESYKKLLAANCAPAL